MALCKYLGTLLLMLIPAYGWCLDLTYDLQVNIDPERREFAGTGLIRANEPAEFHLSVAGLQDVRINDRPVTPDGHQRIAVHLAGGEKARLTYKAVTKNKPQPATKPKPVRTPASKQLVVQKDKEASPEQVIPMDDDFQDF